MSGPNDLARALALAAVVCIVLQPAQAQTAAISLSPGEAKVLSAGIFTAWNETFQIEGVRVARVSRARCFFERLKGRQGCKQLRRLLNAGPIVVQPTGDKSPRGYTLARVRVNGESIRTRLIEARVAVPRPTGDSASPWCIHLF